MPSKFANEMAAQAWAKPAAAGMVMDGQLAHAFADVIDELLSTTAPLPDPSAPTPPAVVALAAIETDDLLAELRNRINDAHWRGVQAGSTDHV